MEEPVKVNKYRVQGPDIEAGISAKGVITVIILIGLVIIVASTSQLWLKWLGWMG